MWRSNSICNLWNKCMLRPLKYMELKTTTPSSFFAVGGWGGGRGGGSVPHRMPRPGLNCNMLNNSSEGGGGLLWLRLNNS